MSVQVIKPGDQPEWVVVPYKVYLELVEKAEMLQDVQDYDSAKAALEHSEDELIPAEVVYAILDGENPIKVWREYRRMHNLKPLKKRGLVFHIYHSWKAINAKARWMFYWLLPKFCLFQLKT